MKYAIVLLLALITMGCPPDDNNGTADDMGGGDAGMEEDTSTEEDMSTEEDVSTEDDMETPEDMESTEDMAPEEDMAPDAQPDAEADAADVTMGDGDTCDVAIDATAGGTFTGDTSAAADDYSASALDDNCPSGNVSGGDIVYRLEPADATDYEITVTPDEASFDPFLYVRSDCAAAACEAGTVLNGPGEAETLSISVPAGTAFYVIVDGELASSGPYTLDVAVQ